ncbi:precorrin-2 C(20)-methyltransferase [Dysgonomonas sp. GY617]|uniref:precorrin-2 C(20)-methyltransferase n=1 Tax=Dysgonomonas sp. GY617 TaxID=2780420 RepID=UPI0018847E34|nr:precorrin-2 C(20)-methyltransferase [Dysgonomonas sp. GY617]MBF0574470.1 precorrin-2 C(20)-methyltransferase [Dysgonomonas sp. GY617]
MYPIAFVSLGPGEADLITLKGLKTLEAADCIFYPATIVKESALSSRALDIMVELEIDSKKAIPFHVPMSKDRSLAIEAYNRVSKEAEQQYLKGLKVAIVAEGDAGFYSSIHYIFDTLTNQNIPVEHIAGIPAFIASGALAGIHIVKQEEELNVIPGIISANDLIGKIESGKVVVIMKVSQCQEAVKECISKIPTATFHYFENVGVKDKEYYTNDIQEIIVRKFPYFSLMIIHQ